jgi:hypothetical protein
MTRSWAALPIIVMAGLPLWVAPSAPVMLIEAVAGLFCALGVLRHALAPVMAGGALAMIGYAFALWSADAGIDVIGAAVFGIALVTLLDLSDAARRWHGAEIATEVMRAQLAFWFGRTGIATTAVALLSLCGTVLAVFVPASGRAIVTGLGALIAFAAALYAGIARGPRQGA